MFRRSRPRDTSGRFVSMRRVMQSRRSPQVSRPAMGKSLLGRTPTAKMTRSPVVPTGGVYNRECDCLAPAA